MIRRKVNDGIVQITLDDRRWYELDGKHYPSATWILNYYFTAMPLKKWLGDHDSYDAAQEEMRFAGDRGSRVHWGVEQLLLGLPLRFDDIPYDYSTSFTLEEWRFIMSAYNWIEKFKPLVLEVEETILGDGYAGTLDLVCMIDNGLIDGVYRKNEETGKLKTFYEKSGEYSKWCIDWKSSSGIWTSHQLQQSAYWAAADGEIERCGIVRLGSNHKAGFEFKEVEDLEQKYKVFRAVREIWAFENPNPHPRFVNVPEELQITDLMKEEVEGGSHTIDDQV